MVAQQCRDLTPEQASSNILGYTVGNDLSCRKFQMPDQAGGQYFFAKAFDRFAPIGPVLVSPETFDKGDGVKLLTRLNGDVMQDGDIMADMIWKPAKILSWMSQGMQTYVRRLVIEATESNRFAIDRYYDSGWNGGYDGYPGRCRRFQRPTPTVEGWRYCRG